MLTSTTVTNAQGVFCRVYSVMCPRAELMEWGEEAMTAGTFIPFVPNQQAEIYQINSMRLRLTVPLLWRLYEPERRGSVMGNWNGNFDGGSSYGGFPYRLTPEEYKRTMYQTRAFVIGNIVGSARGNPISLEELQKKCAEKYPLVGKLYSGSFSDCFLVELRKSELDFHVTQETGRLVFDGIQILEDDDGVVHKAERPVRKYLRKSDETSVIDLFDGHIEEDEEGEIRVRDLRKLHEALDIAEDFETVLGRLKSIGMSLDKPLYKKTGKRRIYLRGVTMGDSGKKLLNQ